MRTQLSLLGVALALAGCQPTHLVYVYDLSLGLDVAYSNEGTGKVVFGYDRGTYAIVPQKDGAELPGADRGEIMSLAGVSHVRIDGLNEIKFDHFIATGQAAQEVAQDPDGLRQIRDAIYGPPEGGK
jgi:hypothetical protein